MASLPFPNAGWPANILHMACLHLGSVFTWVPVNETRNPFDVYRQLSACGLV